MSSYFAHSTHFVRPRPFGPLVPVPGRTLFTLPIGSPHGDQRAEMQAEKESQYEHQMVPKLQVSESRTPSLIRG
ncbi:hypothetical protein V2G26_013540 [Clonostachys chloroleuca]